MSIEVGSDKAICCKCGTAYGQRKGFFQRSYSFQHKGTGYIPICKTCIEQMYNTYLAQCNNSKDAIHQMCRKLDLYWNEEVFEVVSKRSSTRSIMSSYITRINSLKLVGKCYDDTLSEEGTLWDFRHPKEPKPDNIHTHADDTDDSPDNSDLPPVSPEVKAYWGKELSDQTCRDLEEKRAYWLSKFPSDVPLDIGTDAIIKQICGLELDISRDRAQGKAVDKSIGALNTLLGSANMKPAQKKDEGDASTENTPFGVWIKKWEDQRPIPEPDPELQDVDGIKKYITVWLFGHLSKMLNIKNTYCKLYEEELAKMRVDRPEYEEEDDDTLLYDIFGDGENNDDAPNLSNSVDSKEGG